ncbi:hypothetical protein V498_01754 [Pseudogymnoascus sp. VKM F-4517 (FW-2822)]|nr:hypothetical protein V498_01754 [Pseudogymnoascus sp. VKM F-4517 (FW-2822)]
MFFAPAQLSLVVTAEPSPVPLQSLGYPVGVLAVPGVNETEPENQQPAISNQQPHFAYIFLLLSPSSTPTTLNGKSTACDSDVVHFFAHPVESGQNLDKRYMGTFLGFYGFPYRPAPEIRIARLSYRGLARDTTLRQLLCLFKTPR